MMYLFGAIAVLWFCFFEYLRHRPENAERGTQHLVMWQVAGLLAVMIVVWLCVTLRVR